MIAVTTLNVLLGIIAGGILAVVVAGLHQRYREHAGVASTLQESLRPPELPLIPGLEVGASFRPAGGGQNVGGDFYDVFARGQRSWVAMIGDVCGKGAPAAALTSLARYTLRTGALEWEPPAKVLALLNQAIRRTRTEGSFCSVAYVRVDQRGDGLTQLVLCSAGHPLPLLLRASGEIETVGQPGTLLGVVREPVLRDNSSWLARGDALLLYTDGVTEAHGEHGEPFGVERLERCLRELRGASASTIANSIVEAAIDFAHEPHRDDIAVLALRATA